jgi:hypothetical protein
MRRRSALLLTCVLALAAGATHAGAMPPAGDPDTPIYCDYGHLSGSSSWPGGIGITSTTNHYRIDIEADCPAWGPAYETVLEALDRVTVSTPLPRISDDAGHYSLHLEGDSVDTCVHGESFNGTLSGEGPEGPVYGSFWFHRETAHLWVAGSLYSGGEEHAFTLWLDIVPNATVTPPPIHVEPSGGLVAQLQAWLVSASPDFSGVCGLSPITNAGIVGHGTIRDPGDRSGPIWDRADQAVLAVGGLQQGTR